MTAKPDKRISKTPLFSNEIRIYRRLRTFYLVTLTLLISLGMAASMYFYDKKVTTDKYVYSYELSIENIVKNLEKAQSERFFDFEKLNREICGELNNARSMLELLNFGIDEQNAINELYNAHVRMPNQIKENIVTETEILRSVLSDIKNTENYGKLRELIKTFDIYDIS